MRHGYEILSLFFAIAMLAWAVPSYAMPEDGLVLYYTFDSATVAGDTVSDVSKGGNDGTLNGGADVQGGVLELNGKDGYVVAGPLEIRTGGVIPFTALGWFRTTQVPNGPLWMWGDNSQPSSSSGAEGPVGWRSSTTKFAAGFYQGGHFYADAEEDYADGEWHFAAQVGEETLGYLYIDGVQISSTTAGYTYAAAPYFLLGARTKNSGSDIDDTEYFQGSIEAVALYSRALSEDEIQSIVQEAFAVSSRDKLAVIWGGLRTEIH